ncbi:MAG TPA: MgtC/SapB family protein [Acidimicrobiales bacterium]
MSAADLHLLARIAVGFALSFVLGFERELRGAAAGDRTFALVGTGAAAVAAVAGRSSPQALGGIVTGVGFIGAGLVFRSPIGRPHGITSAAAVWAVAAIGMVAGLGHPVLAVCLTAVVLVDLELRHVPLLSRLDSRRYAAMVEPDEPRGSEDAGQ